MNTSSPLIASSLPTTHPWAVRSKARRQRKQPSRQR
jgi:hypothetical protein